MADGFPLGRAALVTALAAALAGCGGGKDEAAARPTQVVAKVNDRELSVHQVNFLLQRAPGVTPQTEKAARAALLERLIEQEAIVQAAVEQKLDRDPDVQQMLEAARRDVLARAYMDRAAAKAPAPAKEAVAKFQAEHPELFEKRRVYRFDELVVPGQLPADLLRQLEAARTLQEAAALLRQRGANLPVSVDAQRATEDLPLALPAKLLAVKAGEVVIYPRENATVIAQVNGWKEVPVPADKAAPAVEGFLMSQQRARTLRDEARRVRDLAKVVYVGEGEALRALRDAPAGAPATTPVAMPAAARQDTVATPAAAATPAEARQDGAPAADAGAEDAEKARRAAREQAMQRGLAGLK